MPLSQLDPALDYPVLPLRDVVVFPQMVLPLFVGRSKSIAALEEAVARGTGVVLVSQRDAESNDPGQKELYDTATYAEIFQLLKIPDGTVKVLVEGKQRVQIDHYLENDKFLCAQVKPIQETKPDAAEIEALRRSLNAEFEQYVKLQRKITEEVLQSVLAMEDNGRAADTICSSLPVSVAKKQEILEKVSVIARLEAVLSLLTGELEIIKVERKIRSRVKKQMEKNQRDFYLNEQVKAIQKELGEDQETAELEEIEKKIKKAGLSKEAKKKAESELKKLKLLSPSSAEANVSRTYLETLVALPWKAKTKVLTDLPKAQSVLDADHDGLTKVKERIMEHLAVQQRVDKIKAPILCLVGPPGVGKTSLGQSIAKATGRKYVRMALGGMRDEAEIRGHRRTYIGSLPGKIVQNLSKVGVRNPLFLLDEIDKLGADYRGDPAAALLEVLDPEQNKTFQDHYLELDFDLSDVMFVATSNSTNIPPALLDRMELIRLSGYTEDEKVQIAMKHLVPKQMDTNGLLKGEIEIAESAVREIVRYYTREAGVRSLEREIGKVCRKVVHASVAKGVKKVTDIALEKTLVTEAHIAKFLGVRKYSFGVADKTNQIGQVVGLAWTEVGGDLLTIEAVATPGKGAALRTGSLGDVMKESVEAARTVVKSRAARLGIRDEAFEKKDIHIHVPEGATPKDGPSAGIAMTTALVSCLTSIPVRADVAMTGEVTLRGEVLAIGGLKEKLLAALRGGIKTVLIPHENEKDLIDMPDNIKTGLTIVPVKWIDQVLELALERQPIPLVADEAQPSEAASTVGTVAKVTTVNATRTKTVRRKPLVN